MFVIVFSILWIEITPLMITVEAFGISFYLNKFLVPKPILENNDFSSDITNRKCPKCIRKPTIWRLHNNAKFIIGLLNLTPA